jgi:hypothetical protein
LDGSPNGFDAHSLRLPNREAKRRRTL